MSGHTKGEWRLDTSGDFHGGYSHRIFFNDSVNGRDIADVHDFSTHEPEAEAVANARLISAAPELLAACELALKSWFSGEICEREMETVLRSAVAKATVR